MVLIDSLPESNYDYYQGIYAVHPTPNEVSSAGQSFKTPTNKRYRLTSVKFYVKRYGNPIGHCVARLYAHTGTFGTDYSQLVEPLLAESEPIALESIGSSWHLEEFVFSGTNQYLMNKNTAYFIMLVIKDGTVNISNRIDMGRDDTSGSPNPSHVGCMNNYYNGWKSYDCYDIIFYVYGITVAEDQDNQVDCEALSYIWYNSSCHVSAPSKGEVINNQVDCERFGYYWFNSSCHSQQEATIDNVKKRLEELIKLAEPTVNVFGNWYLAMEEIYSPKTGLKLPLVTVRISPYSLEEMTFGRRIPESGSMVKLNFTIHCFAEACELEGEEKYKYAHDLADKIMTYLTTRVWDMIPHDSYSIVDVYNLSARESEPSKGSRKICRMILEGVILAKRSD